MAISTPQDQYIKVGQINTRYWGAGLHWQLLSAKRSTFI